MKRAWLIGNLTRDPVLAYLPSGTAVCDVSIAVNDRVKRGGEWQEEVSYFDLTLFGRTAEVAAEYTHKGSKVAVDGQLKQETWADKDTGAKRSKVKIIVDRLDLLGSPGERRREEQEQPESDEIPF